MKNVVKKLLLLTTIIFVLMLAVDGIVIRVIDNRYGDKDRLIVNATEKILQDLEHGMKNEKEYSEILERNLTETELLERRKLAAQRSLLIYNNLGLRVDFALPDGTLMLDEDKILIDISVRTEDDSLYFDVFSLDDSKLLERYRSYWEDSFYSYDKNTKEVVERYRYYQLVFDKFYLDDTTLLPEKVSIYKVERQPINAEDYPEITKCELMETVEYEVADKTGLVCYELETVIDADTIAGLTYDYTRDDVTGYHVKRDCTLNGKAYSIEERRKFLQECMDEQYESKDRDLVGFSNYYYCKKSQNSNLLGGEVTMLHCEQSILYNMYLYAWKFTLLVIALEMAVSFGIAGIVVAIQIKKENQ